ncbi:MAG: hypothetical protein AAF902_12055 [Chloroflexota bacterium]
MNRKNGKKRLFKPNTLISICIFLILILASCNSNQEDSQPAEEQPDEGSSEQAGEADGDSEDSDGSSGEAEEPEPSEASEPSEATEPSEGDSTEDDPSADDSTGDESLGSEGEDSAVTEDPGTVSGKLQNDGRIEFEAGTTSTTIEGEIEAGATNTYVLQVADGQVMTVNLAGLDGAGIGLSDSGGLLLESETPVTSWTVDSLTAGDITLTVASPTEGSYELFVSVEDSAPAADGTPDGIPVTLNPLGEVVLVFPGSDAAALRDTFIQVDGIEVYKAGEMTPSFTIPYRSETEVPVSTDTLIVEDVNFDGFTDLGIPLFTTAGSNLPLAYWLWDQSIGQFIRSEPFDVLIAPTIMPDKRILTFSRFGAGNIDYVLFMVGKGGPIAVARQSCEFVTADDGAAVARNIGYSIDLQGVETQLFTEDAESCLEFKAMP